MISYGAMPFHVRAYSFKAELICPDCICKWAEKELAEAGYGVDELETMIRLNPPKTNVGFRAWRSESLLPYVADYCNFDSGMNINLDDVYSFDSSQFPKVVFNDQIENGEACDKCNSVF
jgi:hypothetical protein